MEKIKNLVGNFGVKFGRVVSEIDHLRALFKLLNAYHWSGVVGDEALRKLNNAMQEVKKILVAKDLNNLSSVHEVADDLYEFYRDIIALEWPWLKSLRDLNIQYLKIYGGDV